MTQGFGWFAYERSNGNVSRSKYVADFGSVTSQDRSYFDDHLIARFPISEAEFHGLSLSDLEAKYPRPEPREATA